MAVICFFFLRRMKAFGWFSELLLEHEEIFWSLFAVDMDHVIEQQLPDSWDSFPLFQLLNDYLANHGIQLSFFFLFFLSSWALSSILFC